MIPDLLTLQITPECFEEKETEEVCPLDIF